VFVTDGFTGNVVLKTAEGASQMVLGLLQLALAREELEKAVRKLGPALEGLHTSFDPDTVGGAHLLGTRGVVVIAHGSSSRRAIANAIDLAAEGVRDDLVAKIAAGVSDFSRVPG